MMATPPVAPGSSEKNVSEKEEGEIMSCVAIFMKRAQVEIITSGRKNSMMFYRETRKLHRMLGKQ